MFHEINFPELNQYNKKGNFIFQPENTLSIVCNAPKDCSGIYLIYSNVKNNLDLIYIGISGRKGLDGKIIHRKGGLRGRFLTGKQFGNRRSITWPLKMREENIEALNIYWWITYDNLVNDFPRDIEMALICKYYELFNDLPKWNNQF